MSKYTIFCPKYTGFCPNCTENCPNSNDIFGNFDNLSPLKIQSQICENECNISNRTLFTALVPINSITLAWSWIFIGDLRCSQNLRAEFFTAGECILNLIPMKWHFISEITKLHFFWHIQVPDRKVRLNWGHWDLNLIVVFYFCWQSDMTHLMTVTNP